MSYGNDLNRRAHPICDTISLNHKLNWTKKNQYEMFIVWPMGNIWSHQFYSRLDIYTTNFHHTQTHISHARILFFKLALITFVVCLLCFRCSVAEVKVNRINFPKMNTTLEPTSNQRLPVHKFPMQCIDLLPTK